MPERTCRHEAAHSFMGRPYTGTVETLIAIDKEMRAAAERLMAGLPTTLREDVKARRARARVRRRVDAEWRQGPTDGLDLLEWLRSLAWEKDKRRRKP
jgi:hypothetical protein